MLKKNFADFDLSHEMNKAISEMGFEEATPIQSLAIGPILADDVGSGQDRADGQRLDRRGLFKAHLGDGLVHFMGKVEIGKILF